MINLMVVTHESLGRAYTALVKHIFGLMPDNIVVVDVSNHETTDVIVNKLNQALKKFDVDSHTLILTDIFGATPCNIARKFVNHNRMLLTGLNVSMMIKAIQNAPLRDDINILANEVKTSAIAGVMLISYKDTGNPI